MRKLNGFTDFAPGSLQRKHNNILWGSSGPSRGPPANTWGNLFVFIISPQEAFTEQFRKSNCFSLLLRQGPTSENFRDSCACRGVTPREPSAKTSGTPGVVLVSPKGAHSRNLRESSGFPDVHPRGPSAQKSSGNPVVFLKVPPESPRRKPEEIHCFPEVHLGCSLRSLKEIL